jgi:carboxymethylenebutenolidase
MRSLAAVVSAFLYLTLFADVSAADRLSITVPTSNGAIVVERWKDAGVSRPAVIILSGSAGFGSPAYDDIGKTFEAAGLDAYLVHVLSPIDLKNIANAGSANARIGYYATRQLAWIAAVQDVISYLRSAPYRVGKIGVVGISLGAEIAAAASSNRTDIGALVLVDGGFPKGYSKPVSSLPPLLLIWGRADRTFPLSTGRKLHEIAEGLGGVAKLDVYEGPHDFFLKFKTSRSKAAYDSATRFLLSELSK